MNTVEPLRPVETGSIRIVDAPVLSISPRAPDEDPAPKAVELAAARTTTLVNELSDAALAQLAEHREQVDALMRRIVARKQALRDAITEHAQIVQEAIETKAIIADAVGAIEMKFAGAQSPTPVAELQPAGD